MAFNRKVLILYLFLLTSFIPRFAYSADFGVFIKELRNIFYSVQGNATLFGYSKDFGFAEIKDGSFKVGDLVLIKSSPHAVGSEELAFGEVEDIKGKIIRIYITNLVKPLKKDAVVVGLKRIYANVKIDDNNPVLKSLFLKEPEIVMQENRDEKTNVIITLNKKDENSYGYKVITAAGRLLLIGNLSLDAKRDMIFQQKALKLAFDEDSGNHWLFKDNELSCYTCVSAKSMKIELEGNVTNIYVDRKKVYMWTDKFKTLVFDNGKVLEYDGLITKGDELLFSPNENKLYDLSKGRILKELPQKIGYLYYWKIESGLGRSGDKLLFFSNEGVKELAIPEMSVVRIKNDKLYLYKEISETVPLSGAYIILYLEIYDLKTLTLQKRLEINESFLDFDVDEKSGELIVLKSDSTIKRIRF